LQVYASAPVEIKMTINTTNTRVKFTIFFKGFFITHKFITYYTQLLNVLFVILIQITSCFDNSFKKMSDELHFRKISWEYRNAKYLVIGKI